MTIGEIVRNAPIGFGSWTLGGIYAHRETLAGAVVWDFFRQLPIEDQLLVVECYTFRDPTARWTTGFREDWRKSMRIILEKGKLEHYLRFLD